MFNECSIFSATQYRCLTRFSDSLSFPIHRNHQGVICGIFRKNVGLDPLPKILLRKKLEASCLSCFIARDPIDTQVINFLLIQNELIHLLPGVAFLLQDIHPFLHVVSIHCGFVCTTDYIRSDYPISFISLSVLLMLNHMS